MSAKVKMPFLDGSGWEDSTIKVAERLMSHYLASDYSQSYFFYKDVSSMAYLLQQYADDITTLCRQMESSLGKYYGRYFDEVEVDVREVDERAREELDVKLGIYVSFQDTTGAAHNLAKILTYHGTTIKTVMNYGNYGLV